MQALSSLGSAGQPIPRLNPTSPCREATGAGAHPGLFRSAQDICLYKVAVDVNHPWIFGCVKTEAKTSLRLKTK